ncbi:MAG: YfiR family protein [Gammaproteobacteria bacterium]|nr:YfiR family protein [Gammaproteobacteria bacterium]
MMRRTTYLLATLLLCIAGVVHADSDQERRLAISISIFPRIVAVDVDLEKKLVQDNIRLLLIYRDHAENAQSAASLLMSKVSNIAGRKVIVEPISLETLESGEAQAFSGALLVEPLSRNELEKVIQLTSDKGLLLFSPYEGDVESGVIASIFVGAKIQPYFNITTIKKSGIRLKPAIMGVSKLYE